MSTEMSLESTMSTESMAIDNWLEVGHLSRINLDGRTIWIKTPTDTKHVYIHGGPTDNDEVFDSWRDWFHSKGIPITVTTDELGQRTLYKHQARIKEGRLVPCCRDFDEKVEGRDLEAESAYIGSC